jgi:hypothetical protein
MSNRRELCAKLREKARLELNEDDEKREVMVREFREWIKKHPRIIYCRTGWYHFRLYKIRIGGLRVKIKLGLPDSGIILK